MDPERIVIVGTGQAGGWAAKTLRDEGFAGRIIAGGEELHTPYERPPLSKAVLAGKAAPDTTRIFKDELWRGLAVDWLPGRRAVALDRAAKSIRLDDGAEIRYDRLLLATGGRARTLTLATPAGGSIHTLRTLDDALALGRILPSCHRLLIIGAGWIGLEVAATARQSGVAVHVVEAQSSVCARALPAEIAPRLQSLHQRHGVTFSLEVTVARIEAVPAGGMRAWLGDGTAVDADCIVAGLGMIANDTLAQDAGIACANGIMVDVRCVTSDPHVFAAGDVALAPNRWADGTIRLESWQNAQDQGIAAARSMLGRDVSYDPVPRFWSDQYDTHIQIVGLAQPAHRIAIREGSDANHFIAFALDGNRVRAAIGVNAGRDMRPARALVEHAVIVDPARLVDAGIDLKNVGAGIT